MSQTQTIEDNSVELRCSTAGTPGDMQTFEWMRVIYASNRIRNGMFGSPLEFHSRGGYHTEEYPDARVAFHREEGYVLVQSKTPEGAATLSAAWAQPGVRKTGTAYDWCGHGCPDAEPDRLRCTRLVHVFSDGSQNGTHMGIDANGRTYRWTGGASNCTFEVAKSGRKIRKLDRTTA